MDKSISWIKTGIEYFADTGKLELNAICKKMGKSKSSFYHIYPNFADSRGFDRYLKDVLDHHERTMSAYYKQIKKMFVVYDLPEAIDEILALAEKYLVYQAFIAQLRILSNKSPELQAYSDRTIKEGLEIIHEFWKVYNVPEDETMDDQELRLFFDSYLHYKEKGFIEDGRSIAFTRLKYRGSH